MKIINNELKFLQTMGVHWPHFNNNWVEFSKFIFKVCPAKNTIGTSVCILLLDMQPLQVALAKIEAYSG